nr:integrase, catalytic region, zinc finger, CCHC-type, peptidase aspartic, catalytic [Tanacetum cinerariifolium]
MSNTNTNLQTQTSNVLHNAIMEAGGKDRLPMLAPGNYVQWKSIIKRYIDTKPNNELMYYCLQNLLYKFKWTKKTILVIEGSSETTTEGYMENYKNVSQDIRNQLDNEAKVVLIILTGIDNDIYSTVDACINAYHNHWLLETEEKQLLALLQTLMIKNLKWLLKMMHCQRKGTDKLLALISLSFKKIYKPTNNNLKTSSNTSRVHQDNTPRINRGTCKNCNKLLESSNETLVDKLRGEIEDFKTKNKSLQSSNNHFKEVNNELSKTNQLMFKDLNKFQAEFDSLNAKTSNVNFICVTYGKCVLNDNHDMCGLHYINGVNTRTKQPIVVLLVEIILFIVDSGCSKHMTRNLKLLSNFVEKFLGTVKFGNDQIALILSYGDLVQGNLTIKRVYYVEGLNHNLFFVGQFCDADLEVAFQNLNVKTSNVNFVCVTCGKCVLNDKHDMCVLHSLNGINSRTKMPMAVPISTKEPKHTVNQSIAKPLRRTVASESTN